MDGLRILLYGVFLSLPLAAYSSIYPWQSSLGIATEMGPKFRRIAYDFPCESVGFFNHHTDCKKFVRCVRYSDESTMFTAFEFECQESTIWDNSVESCIPGKCASEGFSIATTKDTNAGAGGGTRDSSLLGEKPDVDAEAASNMAAEEKAPSSQPEPAPSTKACPNGDDSYLTSDQYYNIFYKCNKESEKYVCNPGSAFDEGRQICIDNLSNPSLLENKEEYVEGSPLQYQIPSGTTALIPLLKTPVQNSESYKLVNYDSMKTYGLKGLEAWVLPLDQKDPSYEPLDVELPDSGTTSPHLKPDGPLFTLNIHGQLKDVDAKFEKLVKDILRRKKQQETTRVTKFPFLGGQTTSENVFKTMIERLKSPTPNPLSPPSHFSSPNEGNEKLPSLSHFQNQFFAYPVTRDELEQSQSLSLQQQLLNYYQNFFGQALLAQLGASYVGSPQPSLTWPTSSFPFTQIGSDQSEDTKAGGTNPLPAAGLSYLQAFGMSPQTPSIGFFPFPYNQLGAATSEDVKKETAQHAAYSSILGLDSQIQPFALGYHPWIHSGNQGLQGTQLPNLHSYGISPLTANSPLGQVYPLQIPTTYLDSIRNYEKLPITQTNNPASFNPHLHYVKPLNAHQMSSNRAQIYPWKHHTPSIFPSTNLDGQHAPFSPYKLKQRN